LQALETRQELQARAAPPPIARIAVLWRVFSPDRIVSTRLGKTVREPARVFGGASPLPGTYFV